MAHATGSNYYKRSLTEYEVEACKRDAAKRAQGCDECSLTEDEVNAYERDQFYAAVAAKNEHDYIERRAELDAEIPALEAEIATAKTEHDHKLAAKIERRAERNFLLYRLEAEIAAAKSKRNNKLAAMDAEITALEAELAAYRAWLWTNHNLPNIFCKLELIKWEKFK